MRRNSILLILILVLGIFVNGCSKKANVGPIGDSAHATDQDGSIAIADEFFKDLEKTDKYIIETIDGKGLKITRTFDGDKIFTDYEDPSSKDFYLFVEDDTEYSLEVGSKEVKDASLTYQIVMQIEPEYVQAVVDSLLFEDYEGLEYDATFKRSEIDGKQHKEMTINVKQKELKADITLIAFNDDNKISYYKYEEKSGDELITYKEGKYTYDDDIKVELPEYKLP